MKPRFDNPFSTSQTGSYDLYAIEISFSARYGNEDEAFCSSGLCAIAAHHPRLT